jgi:hypothetical protein
MCKGPKTESYHEIYTSIPRAEQFDRAYSVMLNTAIHVSVYIQTILSTSSRVNVAHVTSQNACLERAVDGQ